jgi:hypothetical protein
VLHHHNVRADALGPPDLAAALPVVLAALRRLPRQQRQAQRADR